MQVLKKFIYCISEDSPEKQNRYVYIIIGIGSRDYGGSWPALRKLETQEN